LQTHFDADQSVTTARDKRRNNHVKRLTDWSSHLG